jgi:hypothetical protein
MRLGDWREIEGMHQCVRSLMHDQLRFFTPNPGQPFHPFSLLLKIDARKANSSLMTDWLR